MTNGTPGLDIHQFAHWLRAHHPHLAETEQVSASVIAGGLSNLTYRLEGTSTPLVLRRPPLGHVLSTAHDMAREFRILQALHGTGVPVPVAHFLEPDDDGAAGVGAPFYVMARVAGSPIRTLGDNDAFSAKELHTLSLQLGTILADLHGMDPAAIGLGDFGRPDGFLSRQLRRWNKQLQSSQSRGTPALNALAAELESGRPETTSVSLLHGDYRLDNAMVARDAAGTPGVTAVLDWEMSTIGDSWTDLGLFGLYWQLPTISGIPQARALSPVDSAAGYPSFDTVVAAYANRRGIDVPDLSWYLAFAAFKLAVILEGIHFRFSQGKTVGAGFESVGGWVEPLASAGRAFLRTANDGES